MDEVERVVRGLSPTMRQAVLRLPEGGGYIQYARIPLGTADALSARGVFAPSDNYSRRFTPLGLQVRKHLETSHG